MSEFIGDIFYEEDGLREEMSLTDEAFLCDGLSCILGQVCLKRMWLALGVYFNYVQLPFPEKCFVYSATKEQVTDRKTGLAAFWKTSLI